MDNILIIDCQDVYLRELTMRDLNDFYELTLQPEITDFLPDWKCTLGQRTDWLTNYEIPSNKEFRNTVPHIVDHWLKLCIIFKETDQLIGIISTGPKDELPAPNREINYAISKDYRGRGYTTQASRALVHYLFEKTDIEALNAIALIHNHPSNRVIQKSGFNYINDIEIDNEEYKSYKLTRNGWESSKHIKT